MSFATSRRFRILSMSLLGVVSASLPAPSRAQEMHHENATGEHAVAKVNVGILTITSGEKSITLSPEQFKTMPHKTITVRNGHTNTDETYSGILLGDLLTHTGAPMGPKLHGKALASYVLATGSDGYQAIYSIAEIDPAFHSGDVIVADTVIGKPLEDGPYKIVNTEDKHPARWVRNLVSIKVVTP